MPGHFLLAEKGKRARQPGGMELTVQMLGALDIQPYDDVVGFAPGLGLTARAALWQNPTTYSGVERNEAGAQAVRGYLDGEGRRCLVGRAESTGLLEQSATGCGGSITEVFGWTRPYA